MYFQLIYVGTQHSNACFSSANEDVDKCTLLMYSTTDYILLLMLCGFAHGKVSSMYFFHPVFVTLL